MMNIGGATILTIICFLIIALPRRFAAVPLLAGMLYVTMGQNVTVAGLHLYPATILAISGMLRLIIRFEFNFSDKGRIGQVLLFWVLVSLVTDFWLHGFGGNIFRIRSVIECLMLYVFFKSIFRSTDDIILVCKFLPLLMLPIACSMVWESMTGHNLFSYFGGVDQISEIRYGHVRSQGPFAHSILAGSFGAVAMPLIAVLWFQESYRKIWCVVGILCSAVIVYTSRSSGPLLTCIIELIAFGSWFFRHNMRRIRWGIGCGLVLITVAMNSPIWNIFAALSGQVRGTGAYRAQLYNAAFGKYFSTWWKTGATYTANWATNPLTDANVDFTSQYLSEGRLGGIFTMLLFILVFVFCFRSIGRALRRDEAAPFPHRIFFWGLGLALFGHVITFLSVEYFDQSIIWYYMLIGAIGALSAMPAFIIKKSASPFPGVAKSKY